MSRRGRYQAGAAALGVLAATTVVAAAVTIGVAGARGADQMSGTTQRVGASAVEASAVDDGAVDDGAVDDSAVHATAADASAVGPATAVTYQVSEAAQGQTLAHWTLRRMQGATSAPLPRGLVRTAYPAVPRTPARPAESHASSEITPPKGTPRAVPFSGSPTTGVLFYTTGGRGHFCTASVVDSTADDLALTAAHCVYWTGLATNIAYVPGYHDGKQPYGVWPVRTITVASGWKAMHDPDLDFAFLTLASAGGRQIQARTGGLTMGFTRWYSEKIEVIGHNDSDAEPVRCATKSFRFRTGQMEFYCHGFWTGTSGGPWIIGYNPKNGTGTVFGVIGGYELGGEYEWASYSAYFGSATRILYEQVERLATPHPTPTPTPTTTPSPSSSPTTTPSPTSSVSTAYRPPVLVG